MIKIIIPFPRITPVAVPKTGSSKFTASARINILNETRTSNKSHKSVNKVRKLFIVDGDGFDSKNKVYEAVHKAKEKINTNWGYSDLYKKYEAVTSDEGKRNIIAKALDDAHKSKT